MHNTNNNANNTNNDDHDNSAKFNDSNWDIVCPTFEELELQENLLRGIYSHGFEKPSPIQSKGIQPLIMGYDTIAQAQAGTGKTATFAIGVLERIDTKINKTQAIILAPTRELANQSYSVVASLGDYLNVKTHPFMGGTKVRDDEAILRKGCHVVIGTPGRVRDLIQRRTLQVRDVKIFVLDEADELLSFGFNSQIYEIFKQLNEEVQVALFSATLPDEVLEISKNFMNSPKKILVKKEELTLAGLQQYYVFCGREEYKLDVVCDLYETLTISQSIIFCNSKRIVDWLTMMMNDRDFTVSAIHGEMEPSERRLIMEEFKSGSTRVLITTDLMARGIDVQQVSLVLNYDLPKDRENYIHRIGRSGRHGRKGAGISLVLDGDVPQLRDIERFYDTDIQEMPSNIADIIA